MGLVKIKLLALTCLIIVSTTAYSPYQHLPIQTWHDRPSAPPPAPVVVALGHNRQISQLDLVASITTLGELNYQEHISIYICDTWIFPIFKGTVDVTPEESHQLELELDLFSSSASRMSYTDMKPVVILPVHGNEENTTRFSYNRILHESDLLLPVIFGFRQKVKNFHCVIVNVPSLRVGLANTMAPILLKYGRPHKDLFIFSSPRMEALHEIFGATRSLREIRFKYGFEIDKNSNGNGSENGNGDEIGNTGTDKRQLIKFYNSCERQEKAERLPLFSRKCFPHISNRDYNVVCTSIKPFLHYDTITTTEELPDGGKVVTTRERPAGVMYSIFAEAGARYNFTFHIEYSSYLGASGFNVNGTWYGAVGQVFAREKDIAFGIVPSVHRFPVVEPIFVTWMIRYFYIRSPPYATTWKAAFLPLNLDVWVWTLSTVLCMVIPCFYAAALLYFKSVPDQKRPENILLEVVDALNRILMEQSATVRHWTGTRIRLLVLLWTAFCLILGTAYRAKLINFLTFLDQEEIPKTHVELSLANDYTLFFRFMGGTAYRFMIESDAPEHKRIMKRSILVNTSVETMFDALFTKKGAWLDYKINAEFAMQENLTTIPSMKISPVFTRSKDTHYVGNFGWGFRKGSPLTESFEGIVGYTIAGGLYDVWKNIDSYKIRVNSARWLRSQEDSSVRRKIETVMEALVKGPKALNNDSFLGAYFLTFAGLGLAAVLWVMENVWFRGKWIREGILGALGKLRPGHGTRNGGVTRGRGNDNLLRKLQQEQPPPPLFTKRNVIGHGGGAAVGAGGEGAAAARVDVNTKYTGTG